MLLNVLVVLLTVYVMFSVAGNIIHLLCVEISLDFMDDTECSLFQQCSIMWNSSQLADVVLVFLFLKFVHKKHLL